MNTPDRQKNLDKKLLNIMTSDKYLHNKATEMKTVIKAGAVITNKKIEIIFDGWLSSAQRRDGDLSLIHFTPDMLSERNKDRFNEAIQGINREEVIDKLNALNKRISKILSNEKYHLARADNILKLKNIDSVLSINHLSSAMNNLQNSLQKKILAEDRSIIEVSPEMLADKHQDKFKTIFSYINREEMLDNLEVVNIIINKLKKVQDHSLFDYLIFSKKEYFHKSDMSIHWLNYFISKKEIKINCYSKGTSLMQRVIERNNKDVAKLLMEKGYTPTKADIELLQFYEKHVVSDDYPFDDGEGALKELRSIEVLLGNKINKQLK